MLDHAQNVFVAAGGGNPVSDDELGVLLRAQTQVVEASLLAVVVESAEGLLGLQDEVGDESRVLDSGHLNGVIGERLHGDT